LSASPEYERRERKPEPHWSSLLAEHRFLDEERNRDQGEHQEKRLE
jgi:hypothetical protein